MKYRTMSYISASASWTWVLAQSSECLSLSGSKTVEELQPTWSVLTLHKSIFYSVEHSVFILLCRKSFSKTLIRFWNWNWNWIGFDGNWFFIHLWLLKKSSSYHWAQQCQGSFTQEVHGKGPKVKYQFLSCPKLDKKWLTFYTQPHLKLVKE